MTLTVRTAGEEATRAAGYALAEVLRAGDTLLLFGDLGAGKTALVKGIARGLGVSEPITSPTFNILLVHPGRIPLYHIDLYRLDQASQLEDIDYFGTLEAGGVTAVEWGDRFAQAAPPDHLGVSIAILGDTIREITLVPVGPRGTALAGQWLEACRSIPGLEIAR